MVETNGFSIAGTVTADTSFASGAFTNFAFSTSDAAKGVLMADAVKVKPPITRKSVPTPMPLDTGKDILSMQVCTLWREGIHLGWSAIDTEETMDAKTLLGWYDEGDPEAADWEIKYAAEHGINNFMYCWYRPDTGGGPIKETNLDDQMWEGYFNAEYKELLNFSIMFTNHSPTRIYSEQDMLENLMPYWIETFFKNPNYLKTSDNKPILYIYQVDELMEWVKNEYGAPAIDPEGHKMYMFDNWNEFGEGHHLQPTYGAPAYKDGKTGFGYLDVIREVFGTTPYDYQHNDLAPLEEGYGPYDKWYPAGWDEPHDPGLNPVDTSISDSAPAADKEIGSNTLGGTTDVAAEGDGALLDYPDSSRVILTQELLQSLAEGGRDVTVRMKEGSFLLPAAGLGKLAETGGLDLICSRQLDITEAKASLRAGGYRPYDRRVYDIRVMQSETDVTDIAGATVSLALENTASLKAKGSVIRISADGALANAEAAFEEGVSFPVTGASLYAVIQK